MTFDYVGENLNYHNYNYDSRYYIYYSGQNHNELSQPHYLTNPNRSNNQTINTVGDNQVDTINNNSLITLRSQASG